MVPEKAVRPESHTVEGAIEAAPLEEVILRLVYETTMARVRHRALLDYLSDRVDLNYDEYEKLFQALAERDGEALFARVMMTDTDFKQHFGDWNAEDVKRYARRRKTSRADSESKG